MSKPVTNDDIERLYGAPTDLEWDNHREHVEAMRKDSEFSLVSKSEATWLCVQSTLGRDGVFDHKSHEIYAWELPVDLDVATAVFCWSTLSHSFEEDVHMWGGGYTSEQSCAAVQAISRHGYRVACQLKVALPCSTIVYYDEAVGHYSAKADIALGPAWHYEITTAMAQDLEPKPVLIAPKFDAQTIRAAIERKRKL